MRVGSGRWSDVKTSDGPWTTLDMMLLLVSPLLSLSLADVFVLDDEKHFRAAMELDTTLLVVIELRRVDSRIVCVRMKL